MTTTTTDTRSFFKKLRSSGGFTEQQANALAEHEAARNEDVLTEKDGQIIVEQMKVMQAKMEAMEAKIMAEISSSKKSTYQAIAIGVGVILAAGLGKGFFPG